LIVVTFVSVVVVRGRGGYPGGEERRAPPSGYAPARMAQPVTIVGATGALGFGLAVRLGREGVPILIGSRDAGRAAEAAERARAAVPNGSFDGLENAEAVTRAEIVILSVPFRNQSENLTNLKDVLRPGQLLVDATVPLAAAVSGKATRTLGVWQGSAAQQAQEMVPEGVAVVSAFHTVSAALLTELEHELDEDVLICGDKRADKERVAELVRRVPGLRPVDCGKLEMARIVETLTPLIISINVRYKTRAGVKITGL
jgi:NADPH-dependent F420 reductase